jgi:uracil-DNA glycosylase family 4
LDNKKNELLLFLKEQLDFFQQIGAEFFPSALTSDSPAAQPYRAAQRTRNSGRSEETNHQLEVFASLEKTILSCKKCPLAAARTQAVPGEGNKKADLLFIGEGPGRDEDLQGKPFVGRAGQLLTKIIEAMMFTREDVYITNIVKCRPPQNRNPEPGEIEHCHPYLLQQIELIQPRTIVTLGKVAAEFFIPHMKSIGAVRGQFHLYRDIPLMPTYHPSYLIRQPGNRSLRKMVWEDMQKVMALLDGS